MTQPSLVALSLSLSVCLCCLSLSVSVSPSISVHLSLFLFLSLSSFLLFSYLFLNFLNQKKKLVHFAHFIISLVDNYRFFKKLYLFSGPFWIDPGAPCWTEGKLSCLYICKNACVTRALLCRGSSEDVGWSQGWELPLSSPGMGQRIVGDQVASQMHCWMFILLGVWRKEQSRWVPLTCLHLSKEEEAYSPETAAILDRACGPWGKTGAAACPRSWNLVGLAQVRTEWVLMSAGECWLPSSCGKG